MLKKSKKKYGRFTLKDVSFAVNPGNICGLIGINGAGKSTTIKIISAMVRPDSGSVSFWGKDRRSFNPNSRVAYVMDSSYFYENQTISQVAKRVAGLFRYWDKKLFQEYLEFFKLTENQKIQTLSKGMKMQLSLSIALSHGADFLILDEPTSGLDPYIRNQLISILKEFVSREGRGVLFSTHITTDLEKAASQVVMLHNGGVVFDSAIEELPILQQKQIGCTWTGLDDCVLNYINKLRDNGNEKNIAAR